MASAKPGENGSSRIRNVGRAVFLGTGLLGAIVLIKTLYLQTFQHGKWLRRYEAQVYTQKRYHFFRKPIVDKNGYPLAITIVEKSVCADPIQVSNPAEAASTLSKILKVPEKTLMKKLSSKKRFTWIKRHISDQKAQLIKRAKIPGIYIIKDRKRYYPHKWLGGQVIGFVGSDGHGLEGIEKCYDDVLSGRESNKKVARDGLGRLLWAGAPEIWADKSELKLTVDSYIQFVSERAIQKCAEKYRAKSAQVVVLDISTFEILAMVNWPFFDPNLYKYYSPEAWRNRVIMDIFEPGSTFKPIVVAAALEEKILRPNSIIFCENGSFRVPGHTIKDVHPHGWLSLSDVVKFSSNIGAAKVAMRLGAERYYHYIRKFGLGSKTGIDLSGEARGIIRDWKSWRPIDLATAAFGQGIGVTVLQLAVTFGAIANDGIIKKPFIIKDHIKQNEGRRIMSRETAREIRKMLVRVTEKGGTGVAAVPEGYKVGGKTGTAQRIDPRTGKYSRGSYTALFVGFAPADNPRIVVAVVVHEPHGAIYGGVVAAPVFREIVQNVLPYLGIFPKSKVENT